MKSAWEEAPQLKSPWCGPFMVNLWKLTDKKSKINLEEWMVELHHLPLTIFRSHIIGRSKQISFVTWQQCWDEKKKWFWYSKAMELKCWDEKSADLNSSVELPRFLVLLLWQQLCWNVEIGKRYGFLTWQLLCWNVEMRKGNGFLTWQQKCWRNDMRTMKRFHTWQQ